MQLIKTEADIDVLFRSAKLLAVIGAWAKNGYFERLGDGEPRRLGELEGDERALQISARVLAHAGFLVGHGDTWGLSPSALGLFHNGVLSPLGPQSLADLSTLDEVIAGGEPVRKTDVGVVKDDPEGARRFMKMLYRRAAESSVETARWISRELDKGSHVLDVGGGHGRYARALVDRGLKATLFDLPLIIEIAREQYQEELGYIEGDFFKDPLGGPYDGALLSNIVHGLGHDENVALLRRLRGSLREGGLLVIKDMFLEESGTQPESGVFFALTMLSYTSRGNSYTFSEAEAWFREASFSPLEPVVCEGFHLYMARAISAR